MKCENCGIDIEGKRTGARFCSPKCKLQAFRKQSVETDNVTFSEPIETDNFEFTIKYKPLNDEQTQTAKEYKKVRSAKYWYNVPLGAIPVVNKDWPKMPEFMNGRQYFLWWKNEFDIDKDGQPIILYPFKRYENVQYYPAGDNSRRWGA